MEALHGILVVDKPGACTSHDVVRWVRKAVGQRSVGHAGTLDPLATGVLVVALGEATKLVAHLQSDDKRYEVTIALGAETDSLDADGEITATAPVPTLDAPTVERALRTFLGKHPQEAPKLSAIKVEGRPLHRRVRKGEAVVAPVREVELHGATVERVEDVEIDLAIHCGKGFYVRSLARDLARALGTVGHVKRLRRTESGSFGLDRAVAGDALTEASIGAHLIPLREACAVLPAVVLTDDGVDHARHGRRIGASDVADGDWAGRPEEDTFALFGPDGEPIALGRRIDAEIRVVRGFRSGAGPVVSP